MDLQKEFNIPVSDADFGSLLSEIEDDELRKIKFRYQKCGTKKNWLVSNLEEIIKKPLYRNCERLCG